MPNIDAMKRNCVCFTTDVTYAFPTLLSAIQARHQLRAADTDVLIILFHDGQDAGGVFTEAAQAKGIGLLPVRLAALQGYTPMYARLFLDEILPDAYGRILYIDGDTQIRGPLDKLIQSPLADDQFMAAADPMAILAEEAGPRAAALARYFATLGVRNAPVSPYFNSGVLLVNRGSWAGICREALSFLAKRPDLCLFQDQSALNFAGHKHLVALSFQWNFPIFFRNCGVEQQIAPRIYHFMAKPKPWNMALPPWNAQFSAPYDALKREFPQLAGYAPPPKRNTYLRYFAQQNVKRIQETIGWRFSKRRAAIMRFNTAGG